MHLFLILTPVSEYTILVFQINMCKSLIYASYSTPMYCIIYVHYAI